MMAGIPMNTPFFIMVKALNMGVGLANLFEKVLDTTVDCIYNNKLIYAAAVLSTTTMACIIAPEETIRFFEDNMNEILIGGVMVVTAHGSIKLAKKIFVSPPIAPILPMHAQTIPAR